MMWHAERSTTATVDVQTKPQPSPGAGRSSIQSRRQAQEITRTATADTTGMAVAGNMRREYEAERTSKPPSERQQPERSRTP